MAERASKEALTTRRIDTGEVEVEGVGTIVVRGLTRWEVFECSARTEEKGTLAGERLTLSLAMVDPPMGEHDVAAWQKASPPGEINEVANEVNRLSKIGPSAAKEQYKSVPDES